MIIRRENAVRLLGRGLTVRGPQLAVGQAAPDFELTTNNWQTATLADYRGKIKLVSVVPSLDTRVCDMQTRRFNEAAANLSENVVVLTVSADLPYAQRRWCGNAGIDRVQTLSDHKNMNFGDAYGVHIEDLRLDQRSVFVIDAQDTLVHVEYVLEFSDQPNYDAAMTAALNALP
ncbi:MAG: thiol peroxidase [Candidatus Promineifilaceae bacterium]